MPVAMYERLTVLDNSFLITESPTNHMHVAGTATYEAGPLRTATGGVDVKRIRAYVESRLHLIPRYRQVLAYTPLEGHPVWVDDQHFNIEYHVRHTSLPRPGDAEQLKALSGRIMSQQLDRSKPLWEMWVVEGLEGGDHFAILSKIHHCMVDGMSSVDLMAVLLAVEPSRPHRPAGALDPAAAARLVADAERGDGPPGAHAVRDRVGLPPGRSPTSATRAPTSAPCGARRAACCARASARSRTRRSTSRSARTAASTGSRWTSNEVKQVRKRLGGSLNDVVLTTVDGRGAALPRRAGASTSISSTSASWRR